MRRDLAAVGVLLMSAGMPGFAHRLDEYLQATLLWVEKDHVGAQIRLTPGVAVFPVVLASIDANADGLISNAEQSSYAARVLRDLSLTIDGDRLQLTLVSAKFATVEEMRGGLGEIQIEFQANLPRGRANRRLVFKNQHLSGMAAYLVNSLVPRDLDIRLTAQNRNEDQSVYQVDYAQAGVSSTPLIFTWWSAAALILLSRLVWLFRTTSRRRRELTADHARTNSRLAC